MVGPLGSGKTTCMIYECLRRAAEQEPGPDGIRRTRVAVVRNTLKQLMSTVLPDILAVLGPIARFHVTSSCVRVRVGDVHSDWYLMPLDTEKDQQRLLSMQLSFAWVAEFREVLPALIPPLRGRTGRYPSEKLAGVNCTWRGVFGESNPFNVDSDWNDTLVISKPPHWGFWHQPGGRTPEAENVEHLPEDYYGDLVDGADPGWVAVHVDAEIGESLEGKGVWRGSYDRNFHVSRGTLELVPFAPLLFSFDFGRTPACLLGQMEPEGRLIVLAEFTSVDSGLERFLEGKVVPGLVGRGWSGVRRVVVGDPAGQHQAQDSENSCFKVLKERGFPVRAASTNEPWPRILAVEKRLNMRKGILIDGRCAVTLSALAGAYRFRKKRTGEIDDLPEKKHPVSDVADCLQYLCLFVDGRSFDRQVQARELRTGGRLGQAVPSGAWT